MNIFKTNMKIAKNNWINLIKLINKNYVIKNKFRFLTKQVH
jgi:hypothetical protein